MKMYDYMPWKSTQGKQPQWDSVIVWAYIGHRWGHTKYNNYFYITKITEAHENQLLTPLNGNGSIIEKYFSHIPANKTETQSEDTSYLALSIISLFLHIF